MMLSREKSRGLTPLGSERVEKLLKFFDGIGAGDRSFVLLCKPGEDIQQKIGQLLIRRRDLPLADSQGWIHEIVLQDVVRLLFELGGGHPMFFLRSV